MLKVLIIEDYPDEADALKQALSRYAKKHDLELQVTWGETAQAIAKGTIVYDLIFLDIELPGMNGMDAATLMRSYDPGTPIIFTTSLSQYAAKSYEVDAAGFIVKPVTLPKLEMVMDKVLGRLRRPDSAKLVFDVRGGIRVVPVSSIRSVELLRHDLCFDLVDGEELKLRGTIKQVLDEAGPDTPLLQVSSGCIANMDHIRSVVGSEVRMDNGRALALSRSRKRAVLETFSAYLGKNN